MDRRTRLTTLILATLTILLASCATDTGTDTGASESEAVPTETLADTVPTEGVIDDPFVGAVEVEDQTSDGTEVTVPTATLEESRGWVVIHLDESGAPGEVIGHAEIPAVSTGDPIVVTLDQPLDTGETVLWAMLHIDAEPVGEYQFPGNDVPVTNDDAVVMAPFTVTVS